MSDKPFILMTIFVFFLFASGYFIFVNYKMTEKRLIPQSYKQFMLESTDEYPGKKMLLVGGSDVHHGINAKMMEKAFKMPVLNLGDNGGYSLRHKIYNLLKYTKMNDIVIFSLGWDFYTTPRDLNMNYIAAISDIKKIYSFYYNNLPVVRKVEFVFRDLPYNKTNLFKYLDPISYIAHQNEAGDTIEKKIDSPLRTNRGSSIKNQKRENKMLGGSSCDSHAFNSSLVQAINRIRKTSEMDIEINRAKMRIKNENSDISEANPELYKYIIWLYILDLEKKGFRINLSEQKLSSNFLGTLNIIDKLRDKGVQVFFTWPILADSESSICYKSNQSVGLDNFSSEIKAAIQDHGYDFLGTFNDSHFPSACFLDNYAHIRADCADDRTNRLISAIKKTTQKPDNKNYDKNYFNSLLNAKILKLRKELTKVAIMHADENLLALPKSGAKGKDLSKLIMLIGGWSVQEDWGIWSKGSSSRIIIRGNKKRKMQKLKIAGKYFNGVEETKLYVNGQHIGNYILEDTEIHLPKNINLNGVIRIKFDHSNPVIPSSLNASFNDNRNIKFGLTYINLL